MAKRLATALFLLFCYAPHELKTLQHHCLVVAKPRLLGLALVLGLLMPTATAQAAAGCQFVLGFATLATAIPQQVGVCADDESHNPQNGDALQHTNTGGLLVWRKADNWTAFTDGFHTWINGPKGVQERLNTEHFPWEATPPASPAPAPSPAASASPSPTSGIPSSLAAEIAAIVVPAGDPPMSALPPQAQSGCVHLAEDLQKAATGVVTMRSDDQYCPYAEDPTWRGFA